MNVLCMYINTYHICIQMGLHHGHTAGNAVSDRYLYVQYVFIYRYTYTYI